MALEWMPRDDGKKDHLLHSESHWGTEDPCVVYEKQPISDPKGNEIKGIYKAVIRLNNPKQYNSYTTERVSVSCKAIPPCNSCNAVSVVCQGSNRPGYMSTMITIVRKIDQVRCVRIDINKIILVPEYSIEIRVVDTSCLPRDSGIDDRNTNTG